MKPLNHIRLLIIVTAAWILFLIAGLPDYYQQYPTSLMIVFDLAILPPIWFIVYRSIKKAEPGRGISVSLWWSFYISVPLLIYDLLYVGIYFGHGMNFFIRYWYLTVYYILPWFIFPPTGWIVEKKKHLS